MLARKQVRASTTEVRAKSVQLSCAQNDEVGQQGIQVVPCCARLPFATSVASCYLRSKKAPIVAMPGATSSLDKSREVLESALPSFQDESGPLPQGHCLVRRNPGTDQHFETLTKSDEHTRYMIYIYNKYNYYEQP